jgi:hypothetical protein
MKPDNKRGKLRFDPDQAFEQLRLKARKALTLSKRDLDEKVEADRRSNRRRRAVRLHD